MKQNGLIRNVIRGILSGILLIIFALSLILATLSPILKDWATEKNVIAATEKAGYVEMVREDISEAFSHLCETSGVPQSVTDAFLKEEVTDEDILMPIRQMFREETLSLDTEKLKANLTERVEKYALSLKASGELNVADEDWEAMVAGFPEMCGYFVKEVSSAIQLSGIFSSLGTVLSLVAKLGPYLLWFGGIGAAVSALLLILIWRKKVLYFGYCGFLASGILFLVPALFYRIENYGMRLGIEPLYLKYFLDRLIRSLCDDFLKAGIILISMGLLCALLGILLMIKRKKQRKEKSI